MLGYGMRAQHSCFLYFLLSFLKPLSVYVKYGVVSKYPWKNNQIMCASETTYWTLEMGALFPLFDFLVILSQYFACLCVFHDHGIMVRNQNEPLDIQHTMEK